MLEREPKLGAHTAHHDLRLRVLEHGPADRRQLARACVAQVEAADLDLAGCLTAVEVRDEAARRAQQRRLPRAGVTGDDDERARLDVEREVRDRGGRRVRIAVGEPPRR